MQQMSNIPRTVFPVHFVTPIIQIITFLLTVNLMILHRRKGIQSSCVLFIFWTLLFISAIPQLVSVLRVTASSRNVFSLIKVLSVESNCYVVYFVTVSLMWLLNCVSDRAPSDYVPKKNVSPEASASFLRQILFQWFDSFMWNGQKKPVVAETVWELNDEDLTTSLSATFDKHWSRSQKDERMKLHTELYQLIWSLYQTVGLPVPITALIRLMVVFLSFVVPQILG